MRKLMRTVAERLKELMADRRIGKHHRTLIAANAPIETAWDERLRRQIATP